MSVYTGKPPNDDSWNSAHLPVYLTSNPIAITPVRPSASGDSGRIAALSSGRRSDGTPVSVRSRNVSPCSVSGVSDPSSAPSVAVTRASDSCDAVSSLSSITVSRAERTPVSSSRRRGDDPTEDDNRVARGASSATYSTPSLCPGAGASSGHRVSTRAVNFALSVTPTREGMSGLARVDNSGNLLSVLHANFTIASDDHFGVSRDGELAGGGPAGSAPSTFPFHVTGASSDLRVSTRAVHSACSVTPTREDISGLTRVDIPGNTLSVPHASVTVARDDKIGVSRDGELVGRRLTGSVPSTSSAPVASRGRAHAGEIASLHHGPATRSFSSCATVNTGRFAAGASVELKGSWTSPIRFVKQGTSPHTDRARDHVHAHNQSTHSTGKGSTTTRGRSSQNTTPSHTPQIRIISYNPMTIESEGRLADICHHFRRSADIIMLQGTGTKDYDGEGQPCGSFWGVQWGWTTRSPGANKSVHAYPNTGRERVPSAYPPGTAISW